MKKDPAELSGEVVVKRSGRSPKEITVDSWSEDHQDSYVMTGGGHTTTAGRL